MTYRIAYVGTGARATAHANAYQLIPGAEHVGCYDLVAERSEAFARTVGIRAFDDLNAMLKSVRPDVVHVTTPPGVRVDVMQAVSDAKVPGCTVEKPISLGVADWRALTDLSRTTSTKFGISHQFRWYPMLIDCRNVLASGDLGNILYLEASARLTISDQGTHLLHYANYLNGDSPIHSVFGTTSGWTPDHRHAGPENALALLIFEVGTRLLWNVGPIAPISGNPNTAWQHVRIAGYAERGHVIWEEFGRWEIRGPNGTKCGRVDADEHARNSLVAQAGFQSDMLRWISEDAGPVGTNLDRSLHEWKAVLALYESTLSRRPVEMTSFEPSLDLDTRLFAALTQPFRQ